MLERDRERSPGRSERRTGEAALQVGAQSEHCVQAARTNSVANALVAQLVGADYPKKRTGTNRVVPLENSHALR